MDGVEYVPYICCVYVRHHGPDGRAASSGAGHESSDDEIV